MNKLDTRHTFMALGIGSVFISPFILILLPSVIANMLHETSSTLFVSIPKSAYYSYGFGLALIVLTFFILFFLQVRKSAKLIGVVLSLVALLSFANGSQQFMLLAAESIIFKESIWSEEHHYSWKDIEEVIYREYPKEGGFPKFDFHFNDGNIMSLPENRNVQAWHNGIRAKLNKMEKDFKRE